MPDFQNFLRAICCYILDAAYWLRGICIHLCPITPPQEASYLRLFSKAQQHRLSRFLSENQTLLLGIPEETESVQAVASQIRAGVIPALLDLAEALPVDAASPQAKQILERFHYFLNQAGTLGDIRGQQLRLAMGLRNRKYMLRQLQGINQRDESQAIKKSQSSLHIRALLALIDETEQALIPLLREDPSRGKCIWLNHRQEAYPDWLQQVFRGVQAVRETLGVNTSIPSVSD